jgi:hypothetical protein
VPPRDGSNVQASYGPNAIRIWARSTTTGSGLTINDLKITTPVVPGETLFPGTVINVSQDLGPVFQEIIIAGVDFKSSSSGTVTLEGKVRSAPVILKGGLVTCHSRRMFQTTKERHGKVKVEVADG